MRKHFRALKDQFICQIANIATYPVIGMVDYGKQCNCWGIIDKDLTMQDVDRSFIATNFEEVDLDNNDDKSLCRYEYLEILVRLAKIKYFDRGAEPTVAKALERLLKQHILPNHCMELPWMPFRKTRLWKLEVDDLFKANKDAID